MTQLSYQCFDDSPSPTEPTSSHQSFTPPHVYKAILPNIVEDDLDSYISSFKDESLKYVCKYPICKGRRDSRTKQHVSIAIFTSKSNARNHVRRDMNIVDAFKCSCGQTFSSEDSAKRHCNTKSAGKVHECPECGHCFERKDYWEVHVKEKKCRRTNRLTPPHQSSPPSPLSLPPPPPLPLPPSSSSSSSSSSHSHSQSDSHHVNLRPHAHYSPVHQYDTECNLINIQTLSPSSYNHYDHSYHPSHSQSQSCGIIQSQYHIPHSHSHSHPNAMNYMLHPLSHHLHNNHSNAYASCSAAYYA